MSELVPRMTVEDCYCGYGREDFILSIDDLAALFHGKALSGDVAAGEYGITISLNDELLDCSLTKSYTDMVLEHIKAEIELFSDEHYSDQLWKEDIFNIIDKHIGGKE